MYLNNINLNETDKKLCSLYNINSKILEEQIKTACAKSYKKELNNLINLINDPNYFRDHDIQEYIGVGYLISIETISNYSIDELINKYFKNINTTSRNYEINIEYIQQYKKEYIKYIEKLTKQLEDLEREN